MATAKKKDYLGTFSGLTRARFLGEPYHLGNNVYTLQPSLLGKYDLLRSISNPASEFDRLVRDLPLEFKSVARTELYRKSGGWIERGEKYRSFKEIEVDGKPFVVPILSKASVGIDTSSESGLTYICIVCFDDADCGRAYLETHLRLPKATQPTEFKWSKLNAAHRDEVTAALPCLIRMSANAILVIKTNALVSPEEKTTDAFIKLIDGCFSGYERLQGEFRARLRERFFSLTNDVATHCDPDFSPMTPDKIVRQLVRVLAAGNPYTPLMVPLKSHESCPIQVADMICGATKNLIREKRYAGVGLQPLPFDNKLKGKDAKAYYWTRQKVDLGAESR
ncbi:MAG: hypothetical protein JRN09_00540 [Nitrososphaerota archaeon]|nr:hypothetical protein [Nitrososphaerota archaeon]